MKFFNIFTSVSNYVCCFYCNQQTQLLCCFCCVRWAKMIWFRENHQRWIFIAPYIYWIYIQFVCVPFDRLFSKTTQSPHISSSCFWVICIHSVQNNWERSSLCVFIFIFSSFAGLDLHAFNSVLIVFGIFNLPDMLNTIKWNVGGAWKDNFMWISFRAI